MVCLVGPEFSRAKVDIGRGQLAVFQKWARAHFFFFWSDPSAAFEFQMESFRNDK